MVHSYKFNYNHDKGKFILFFELNFFHRIASWTFCVYITAFSFFCLPQSLPPMLRLWWCNNLNKEISIPFTKLQNLLLNGMFLIKKNPLLFHQNKKKNIWAKSQWTKISNNLICCVKYRFPSLFGLCCSPSIWDQTWACFSGIFLCWWLFSGFLVLELWKQGRQITRAQFNFSKIL